MRGGDTSLGGPRRQFPSTLWSDILAAQEGDRAKLEQLLLAYWKPVYAYIRTISGRGSEDAKDLTQSFFTRLLEKDYFSQLRPERGSFRGFLKVSARRFLINAAEAERARPAVRLEGAVEEVVAAPDETPEQLFDRQWFHVLLQDAIASLESRLRGEDKERYFQVFSAYCLEPEETSYAGLAIRLGLSESDVRNYLSYARRALREILVHRIRDYVESDDEVERELGEAAAP